MDGAIIDNLIFGMWFLLLTVFLSHIWGRLKKPACPRCGCLLIKAPGIDEMICYNCGYKRRKKK